MLASFLNSGFYKFIRKSTFIKVAAAAGLFLAFTLVVQAYFVFFGEDDGADEARTATVRVNIGEMYFEQEGADLPRNVLQARVGDVIEFYNEGSITHTATVPEFDFDEVLTPGDSASLRVDRPVTEAIVNCRFHAGHDAVLTVVEADDEHGHHYEIEYAVDEGDLPVRSHADVEKVLDYRMTSDGYKEFRLTAEEVMWQYSEDHTVRSWGYNGQIPGPEIRVTEGDNVRIVVENKLPAATTVHWHGLDVPNDQDGVPGVTQGAIEPGETFTYEFEAIPAGTRFYHSHGSAHHDEGRQVEMGLFGPFIIEPVNYQAPDKEFILALTERPGEGIYPINGRIYPDPEELVVSEGDRVLVRMFNPGPAAAHPMHLHGHQFRVTATDGNLVPSAAQLTKNNLTVHPGDSYDIEFTANNPGEWVFHCHDLDHAHGGMITVLTYE